MTSALSATSTDPYMDLVLCFPLRPIRTKSGYQQAKSTLRSLTGRRGSAVRDYKMVLLSLISEYERSAHLQLDTSRITAAQIVHHLLEEREMSVNALAKALKISQSSLSSMLNGRRAWSKTAIVRLANYFGLQPMVFLRKN